MKFAFAFVVVVAAIEAELSEVDMAITTEMPEEFEITELLEEAALPEDLYTTDAPEDESDEIEKEADEIETTEMPEEVEEVSTTEEPEYESAQI